MLSLQRAALLCLLVCCLPVQTAAFFPATEDVAGQLVQSVGDVTSLKARIAFDAYPEVELLVWQRESDWRQEWVETVNATAVLEAASIGRVTRLLGGYPGGTLFNVPPFWFWNQSNPIVWWSRLGIDPEIKSYQFLYGRPCLVLGAVTGDQLSPQFWVDVERNVPVRVRSSGGRQWDWFEYRYISNYYLPHKAAASAGSENATLMTVEWRGINSEHPRHLYDGKEFSLRFSIPALNVSLPEPLYRLQPTLPAALP